MKFSYYHSIFDVNCFVFIDCVTLHHIEIGKDIHIKQRCGIMIQIPKNHISRSNILDILSIIFERKMNSFTE